MRAYRTLVREVQAAGSDSKKRRAVTQFMGSDYLRNLRVEVEDVNAIAPFILYSKIQLNQQWMKKHFQGNKFLAVQYVMQTAQERFSTFYRDHYKELLGYQTTGDDTSFMNFLRKYAKEKDPWMANIHDFENRSEDYELHTGEIIGGWK